MHPFRARVRTPGSKSITNRALICAALAKGRSVIHNASDSDDTALMANGLNQLGVLVRRQEDKLIVEGTGGKLYAPKFPIPVKNAGTTLRFLLSLAALAEGRTVFEGEPRMAERPIDDLVAALESLGVKAEVFPQHSKYSVEGKSLSGGEVRLTSAKSSQFLSSLLMVNPYATRDVFIRLDGKLASSSYVDMTIDVMKKFGVDGVSTSESSYTIRTGQRFTPVEYVVEADASGASYFLAAAAIGKSEIIVEGLKRQGLQGDAGFISLLERMGCRSEELNDGIRLTGIEVLRGIDVDMNSMPDVVPTLAVVALFAGSPTRIRNVQHLRHKESDRLEALLTELQKAGADIRQTDDGLEIHPAQLHGAALDTYNDHRLAMSFALVGLRVQGISVENPECVRKSFPKFWREFEKLSITSN